MAIRRLPFGQDQPQPLVERRPGGRELAGVRSFLDVGSGIGLLAIAAAGVWPQAAIVGIDVWGPSLEAAMPRLYRALRPGGWLVLGRMAPPPDPLAQAVSTLRTIRGGGADFDAKRLAAALEAAGCTAVRAVPRQGPAPLDYIIGRRATAGARQDGDG